MNHQKSLNVKKQKRQVRTRAKLAGTAQCPRIAVFRSNKALSAQLIDDASGKTLAFASSRLLSAAEQKKNKTEQATLVGTQFSQKAQAAGCTRAIFDRRSYRYHGRVRAFADAARSAGLTF